MGRIRSSLRERYVHLLQRGYRYLLRERPKLALHVIPVFTTIHPRYVSRPFKLHYVDPGRITHICGPPRLYGVVIGGDWDLELRPFKESGAYRSISPYVENGDTEVFHEIFKRHVLDERSRSWGYDSPESFEERLEEIDSLRESIERRGYVSQRELLEQRGEIVREQNNEPVPAELNEITVNVGRNGELLYAGFGAHRLAMAKSLDLDEVPVIIATRHAEAVEDSKHSR